MESCNYDKVNVMETFTSGDLSLICQTPFKNDPKFRPKFTKQWCWVEYWIVWVQCWIIQHWHFWYSVKFVWGQKHWAKAVNNSIVFKYWIKCWVVWAFLYVKQTVVGNACILYFAFIMLINYQWIHGVDSTYLMALHFFM